MSYISLIAQNAYNGLSSIFNGSTSSPSKNQDEFKSMFNAYSRMSPDEIISRMRETKVQNNFSLSNTVGEVSKNLNKNEHTASKALLGKASMLELAETTTQAVLTVKKITAVRDQLLQVHERFWSMQI